MKLTFAHIADYAGADASGKLTIVGLFTVIHDRLKVRPIPFPQFSIVAVFEAHVTEGTDHQAEVRFLNSDGQPVLPPFGGQIKFRPQGKGKPLQAPLILAFPNGAIRVPELGDYEFRFWIDGRDVDGLGVSVIEPPPAR